MKASGGAGVFLHAFLISTLVETGQPQAPVALLAVKKLSLDWVGPKNSLDFRRSAFYPCRESNPERVSS